jgi:hypothetical protein
MGAIQLGLGALASFAVGVLLKFDVAYGFNYDCFNRISTYYFDSWKTNIKTITTSLNQEMVTVH